ncbi:MULTISPECIES: adenylate/guanylate cyclase domain-containing protein [Pseudomonadota]|jgi:class 3 adenylate cyclase|uniref:adenylate/guanylate cyclase domain-containing protein n=2 Tax=Pseudomonadota TaxID=1224 RepID=UPI00076A9374|nr:MULTISPECIES: adenylate/guanylate cyclase domain-containing protein [Pseudomonadota]MAF63986.1 adenylate/guanylate cyclase domain-containing protein [Blastomonas sp.]|tara:strand:- start:1407 stop:2045 length:639 start_codon:yes stop_codon:yes gene_type:complete
MTLPPDEDDDTPLALRNSRTTLDRLLDEMIEQPENLPSIAERIHQVFGETRAVMVLDMSGFSRTTQRHGVAAFLLMVHQMKRLALPEIEDHGGLLIKAEADNLYCLFDDTDDAVRAARGIMRQLNAANMVLPEERKLYASIGIGYGQVLNIDDEDVFGDEMNLTCKLGEDVAQRSEILLTEGARATLTLKHVETRPEQVSISGLVLTYHVVS